MKKYLLALMIILLVGCAPAVASLTTAPGNTSDISAPSNDIDIDESVDTIDPSVAEAGQAPEQPVVSKAVASQSAPTATTTPVPTSVSATTSSDDVSSDDTSSSAAGSSAASQTSGVQASGSTSSGNYLMAPSDVISPTVKATMPRIVVVEGSNKHKATITPEPYRIYTQVERDNTTYYVEKIVNEYCYKYHGKKFCKQQTVSKTQK